METLFIILMSAVGVFNLICFGALFRAGLKQKGFYGFASGWLLMMIVVSVIYRMA